MQTFLTLFLIAQFNSMPSEVRGQIAALGERARVAGREQSLYSGEFVDAAGNRSAARLVHQAPGLVRLHGFTGAGSVLSFDGANASAALTRNREVLLETFILDMPEGMLSSLQQGASVRLLGRRFGPDPRKAPNYAGPRYDIYEVMAHVRTRANPVARIKRYYFDSKTGLLARVRYSDATVSPAVNVETRFSGWTNVAGSAYPGGIERYENGRLVFSFNTATVSSGPRQEPETFR